MTAIRVPRPPSPCSSVPIAAIAAPGDTFTGAPVFFVGGAGASTLMLRPLADAMAPRPFYGFQQDTPGLETRARPDPSVEAATRSYLTEVRSIQPRGPYRLGGYSLGGLIAFEMACRLTATGDTVKCWRSSTRRRPALEPRSSRRSRGRVGVHSPRRGASGSASGPSA